MWRLVSSSAIVRRGATKALGRQGLVTATAAGGFRCASLLVHTCNESSPRHHPRPLNAVRYFSRRPKDHLDDPTEELLEETESKVWKENEGTMASWDMEFFGDEMAAAAGSYVDNENEEEVEEEEERAARLNEEYRRKQEEIQRELDSRTGRPWQDPWAIKEEQWMSSATYDDMPDWTPDQVSRISQERVQVHPDGIPTLSTLASISLPPPASPHPGLGEAKAYAKYRKQAQYHYVAQQTRVVAKDQVEAIMKLSDWDQKQDAVDELFESVLEELKVKEDILGKHPEFPKWVERGLEDFLRQVNKGVDATQVGEETAVPVFMDCYNAEEGESVVVPKILNPLQPHKHEGPGRMVEEWEMAAHKKTKRILIRGCTQSIAKILESNTASRILVHGRKGVGKSAVLASIVASARKSGHIVLYLPDGDRLRKNGFFVTPNAQRQGMFDLQNLSQEACEQLLVNHSDDLVGMEASKATMEYYFKDTQLSRIPDYSGDSMSLVGLLEYAKERKNHAPMCYSVVVDHLMNQEEKPFLMVMDEFNCYYDHGHYFHMAYDEDVREPIPYEKINLFEHALNAMSLSVDEDAETEAALRLMKRGAVIGGTTESHAVRRKVTDALVTSAQNQSSEMHVIDVPRFSDVEVEHIISNFECIGLGKLRSDRGDTVMNEQEVAYLKMVSGSIGQNLVDISVL
ncbi:mitochondrial ribosomal death-associated protein 3 [Nitzschia inconspicua]|uniref:Small ribosomal subunit protein mS29 n=1 Tax=Nitzschia inconspicua TaxID=303405 RepID=A0A9K3Q2K7_9STRA|nr:mitochondrial ribosomal death-associated protein 3 [Nitzschia inconspicua]